MKIDDRASHKNRIVHRDSFGKGLLAGRQRTSLIELLSVKSITNRLIQRFYVSSSFLSSLFLETFSLIKWAIQFHIVYTQSDPKKK